ncbi:MAG: hypothetical protein U0Q47_13495 [Mycobacterium sp.]
MAIFTVTTLADSVDPSDGKLSLREALASANADSDADTITFAGSLEGGTITLAAGQLTAAHDVGIDADPDHDGSGITIDAHDASRVLLISGADTDAEIDGLTIERGRTGDRENGAGILHQGSTLVITNSTIKDNAAGSTANDEVSGGGIAATGQLVVLTSTIENNSAMNRGGGILMGDGYIADSVIRNNHAGNSFYGDNFGGGIAAHALSIVRSSIVENAALDRYGGRGGGILADELLLDTCTVGHNAALGDYERGRGGAIFAGKAIITNATITANLSFKENVEPAIPAAVYADEARVENSIITGNSLIGDGGALKAGPDLESPSITSNGHNVLGKVVGGGTVEGDVVGAAASQVFAAIDLATGGGQLVLVDGTWVVPLLDALSNPALSGAEPALAGDVDQRGAARPLPSASNPDVGAYELSQTHVSKIASAGNDVMTGTTGLDTLAGKAGNDLLRGLAGNDTLKGESGGDTLQGGMGDDRLDGGTGNDTASFRDARGAIEVSLRNGTADGQGHDTLVSIENVVGGGFNDSLAGYTGANALFGLGGNDKLFGLGGNDVLRGGSGDDTLTGGLGDDRLFGGAGRDTASYTDAAAGVQVSLATGLADGALGKDRLFGIENLTGGKYADKLTGDAGTNTLTGGLGHDTLTGNAGADLFDFNTAADSGLGRNADWIKDFEGVGVAASDRIDLADVYAGTLLFKGTAAFTGIDQVRVVASGSDTVVQVNLSGTTAPEMDIHVQDGVATPDQWVAGDFIL